MTTITMRALVGQDTGISRITKSCAAVFALWATTPTQAAVFHTANVASINALTNGGFILTLGADSSSCTNGSTPKQYFAMPGQNNMTVEGAAMNYANSLFAMQTGRPVTLFFDDASALCYIGNIKVAS